MFHPQVAASDGGFSAAQEFYADVAHVIAFGNPSLEIVEMACQL